MTTNTANAPTAHDLPALLTQAELAAVAGGIHIVPKSPPFGQPDPHQSPDPLPPPGGYTP